MIWFRLWKFLRDRRGVAAVEAALAASLVLVPLCLGMIDYGVALADTAKLDRALQAAVLYVASNPSGFTSAGIASAGAAGYGTTLPTLTVNSAVSCKCVSSGYNPVSTVTCSGTCTSGQQVASYVTITASASFTLPLSLPYIASPLSESISGTVRTQ